MFIDLDNCTAEAVLAGHPDKICDQVADAILDEYLTVDPRASVAIECLGCGTTLIVAGEVFSTAEVDVVGAAKTTYREIGYSTDLRVVSQIQTQSKQLRNAVVSGGANDQTIVYGFACDDDSNLLPRAVFLANALAKAIDDLRRQTEWLLPDGKVLVSIKNGSVDTVVLSVQHPVEADRSALKDLVVTKAVEKVLPVNGVRKLYFNHNSDFVAGGFCNDTGLTGRKLATDTYGGLIPNGGGSFSGKDPSKIDRSGAYMARFIAKCIVANGLADSCLVSMSYAFGIEEPIMFLVSTGDPQRDRRLQALAHDRFDLRASAIVDRLSLRRPIYRRTSTYGHFADPEYPWEHTIQL